MTFAHTIGEFGVVLIPASINDEVLGHLKSRLEADYRRSREMYNNYLEQEKRRLAQEEIRMQERMAAYQGQAAGLLIAQIDENSDMNEFNEMLAAMRLSAVKRKPPTIKSTVYMIHRPLKPSSGGEENEKARMPSH